MKICRSCFKIITSPECYSINQSHPNPECTVLRDKIKACIPELDLDLTTDPVLCGFCYNTFNLFYYLRLTCLETQDKIRNLVPDQHFVDLGALQQHQTSGANCASSAQGEPIVPVVKTECEESLDNNVDHTEAVENSANVEAREISDMEEFFENKTVSVEFPSDGDGISNSVANRQEPNMNNSENSCKTEELTQSTSSAEFLDCRFISRSQKVFRCSECSYITSYQINLKKHERRHKERKSFVCKKCGYIALENWSLRSHMTMHTSTKLYKCKECNYETAYRSKLVIHLRKHTGEKPYRCSICNNRYMQSNSLTSHILKTHSNTGWYKCSRCDYKTCYKSQLRNHTMVHTGEKSYMCNICNKRFAHKLTLRRHVNYHNVYHSTNAGTDHDNGESAKAEQENTR